MTLDYTMNNQSDKPLFNDRNFDEATFKVFFKEYFTPLCSYCQYKFGFDLDVAKDIVQTSFMKLWETRQSISGETPVKTYVYKIITNACLDTVRHGTVKDKHKRYVLQNSADSIFNKDFEFLEFKQLTQDVDKAVSELPEQMRKVFELCRYQGFKYAEVAYYLSISLKTVETQMSRALKKLHQKLSGYLTLSFLALTLIIFQ